MVALENKATRRSASLLDNIQRYIQNRKDHRFHELAENARHVLADFAKCVDVRTVKAITTKHLTAYVKYRHDEGDADRTISNKYDRVRAFLKLAGNDVKLSTSDRPKFETKLPTVYTKAEVDRLLEHSDALPPAEGL